MNSPTFRQVFGIDREALARISIDFGTKATQTLTFSAHRSNCFVLGFSKTPRNPCIRHFSLTRRGTAAGLDLRVRLTRFLPGCLDWNRNRSVPVQR